MTEWLKVKANSNLIQAETDRAVLIKLPKTELCFWHPSKLVKYSGKKGYKITISYTDGWKFIAKRTSQKTKAILEEREIPAEKFPSYFGQMTEENKKFNLATEAEKHVPDNEDADNVEVELIDEITT